MSHILSPRSLSKWRLAALALGIAALGIGFAAFTGPALAHPGHGDPISSEQAVQRAVVQIERLVGEGKLDKSWKVQSELRSAELKKKAEAREWEVQFVNATVAAAGKKTLYVFLSETGEYLAANFSGK